MVVIRLTRIGKKKQAFYRVVVADSKKSVTSKFIEILGWFNPKTKELNLKTDRVAEWFSKGAQPSNTVAKLMKANGVKLPSYVVITEKVSKPKKEPVAKPEKVEAPTAEAEESVTEEAPSIEDAPAEENAEAISEEAADVIEEKAEEAEEKAETE